MPVSLRAIFKNWKLSAIAAISLTVAMALAIVTFAISDVLLLRPPLAKNPAELVAIFTRTPRERFGRVSLPDYEYYRDNNRVFSDIAAYPNSISINAGNFENRIVIVSSCPVSDNYFRVMGIQPFMGRFFEPGDDRRHTPSAVLTYAGWERLNRDPNIVGKQIFHATIIGVAPKAFKGAAFGFEPDVIHHLDLGEDDLRRDRRGFILLGRLKPGVSREQARAEMEGLSLELARAYPKEDQDRVADLTPAGMLPPDSASDARLMSALLIIASFFILLLACANAANLLLAIATGRRREALIKVALGASRGRLIREFLVETGVLCASSAVCGFGLALAAMSKLGQFETRLPGFGELRLGAELHAGWVVFAGSAAMATIACLATGIVPALYGSSGNLASALGGEVVVGGTKKGAIRNGLVIVQVAVSTLALAGVALCYRSLHNLRSVDPGFSARNLVGAMVGTDEEGFNETKARALYGNLREAAAKIHGVEAVTLASGMPLELGGEDEEVRAEDSTQPAIRVRGGVVDGDYFSTAGIRLLSGRAFDWSDREKAPEVVMVSQELARRMWPGADPVGRTIHIGNGKRVARVIGVAADVKISDLDEAPQPFLYFALMQHTRPYLTLMARTSGNPRLWIEPLARAMLALSVRLPVPAKTIADVFDISVLFNIWVFDAVSAVSGLALMLAAIGLFGAVSYSVGERKRELGIRVALGALPWHLLKMILGETLRVAGAGVGAGLVLGIVASTLLRSQFYGVHRVEWTVLAPVAIAMTLVVCAIAHFAARGAVHADPMDTLRHS